MPFVSRRAPLFMSAADQSWLNRLSQSRSESAAMRPIGRGCSISPVRNLRILQCWCKCLASRRVDHTSSV